MDKSDRILITGGTGMVGQALRRFLEEKGYVSVCAVGSKDFDLRKDSNTNDLFNGYSPAYVFHLAADVYGILGNNRYKADILYNNVMINTNVLEYARRCNVKKIVAMGSGCIYPEVNNGRDLKEDQIWLGPPHPSEDSYAHAKRLMLAQLQALKEQYGFKSAFAISGNLYGPNDTFHEDGHVIPSLIKKFYDAEKSNKVLKVWGSGVAIRDFTYVEDAAKALYEIMLHAEGSINLGSSNIYSVYTVVDLLKQLCKDISVEWDNTKPDGQLIRYYNLTKLRNIGFVPEVPLFDGLKKTYEWYCNEQD